MKRFPPEKASELFWLREQSVLVNRRGNLLLAQGNAGGALAAYRESLEVRRRLAEGDPLNLALQRDVSMSLTGMALLHEWTGDREEARRLAKESLDITGRLAALDPLNATWQNDMSISRKLVARLEQR